MWKFGKKYLQVCHRIYRCYIFSDGLNYVAYLLIFIRTLWLSKTLYYFSSSNTIFGVTASFCASCFKKSQSRNQEIIQPDTNCGSKLFSNNMLFSNAERNRKFMHSIKDCQFCVCIYKIKSILLIVSVFNYAKCQSQINR